MMNENTQFKSGFVVLAGLPNVGKSTLINRLSGFKISIISPKPQTTRNNILAIVDGSGFQAVFVDTPGILRPSCGLQRQMTASSKKAVREDADILCLMAEPGIPSAQEIPLLESMFHADCVKILAINKIDLAQNNSILDKTAEFYAEKFAFKKIFRLSALTGAGTGDLKKFIIASLPEHPPYYPEGCFTDRWERFYAGELIRENIFNMYSQEVPYATAVEIETYHEHPDCDFIRAVIHTEKPSLKPILIGKKGINLKTLREKSQAAIKELTGRNARLELFIKVTKDWHEKKFWND